MENKKWYVVKVCIGTESYVNSRYETDIKDVFEYYVFSEDEYKENAHDIVKTISICHDRNEAIQIKSEYEECEYYSDMFY